MSVAWYSFSDLLVQMHNEQACAVGPAANENSEICCVIAPEALYTAANPFVEPEALEHSSYAASVRGELIRLLDFRPSSTEAQYAHITLQAALLHPEFPCVGAKSALRRSMLRMGHYARFADPAVTAGLARDLFAFVTEVQAADYPFATFVATFAGVTSETEEMFERELWRQLRLLHERDATFHEWDPAVARQPDDPQFAFSFGGMAFFAVGLHPHSGRWSRRLPFNAIAFNPRRQFDRLRAGGEFERMQAVIRRADERLQGSVNPMLDSSTPTSEARQYSGRAVGSDWRCPFADSVP